MKHHDKKGGYSRVETTVIGSNSTKSYNYRTLEKEYVILSTEIFNRINHHSKNSLHDEMEEFADKIKQFLKTTDRLHKAIIEYSGSVEGGAELLEVVMANSIAELHELKVTVNRYAALEEEAKTRSSIVLPDDEDLKKALKDYFELMDKRFDDMFNYTIVGTVKNSSILGDDIPYSH